MATLELDIPKDLLDKLAKLEERTDEISEKVLEAGGEVLLKQVQTNLAAAVGAGTKYPSRSTGELQNALGMTPPKKDRNGVNNIKVGFSEPRSNGEANAKIANVIEYGKHGQPARPFMNPAVTMAEASAVAAMQRKFDEEVGSL